MKFNRGIYASVTLKKDIEENCSESHYFYDSQSVYDFLIDHFDHNTCANAESWTELASVGEWYEDDDFEIEMMED